MLVAFSVAPSGAGRAAESSGAGRAADEPSGASAAAGQDDASVAAAVAAAVRVVRESGLPNRTDAMFTTIEGDWDACFDVVKRATEAVAPYGSRVSLVLKADIRPGRTGELTGKVDRLESALADPGRRAD